MDPKHTIRAFDAFLARRGLLLDAVIVGGTALGLLGVITRPTRDCDVLQPRLRGPVQQAARDFAAEVRRSGELLGDDWLNDGPSSLVDELLQVLPWREARDANPDWPAHVRATTVDLGRRLGHAV